MAIVLTRLSALVEEGESLYQQSEWSQAARAWRAGLDLAAEMEGGGAMAARMEHSLASGLGRCHHSVQEWEEAICYYTQAVESIRDLAGQPVSQPELASSLCNLGMCYRERGQFAEAIDRLSEASEMMRDAGDCRGEAVAVSELGVCCLLLGQYERAIKYSDQARGIAKTLTDSVQREMRELGNLGVCWKGLGQYERAMECHDQGLEIARELGDRQAESNFLGNIGVCLMAVGKFEEAAVHHGQALSLSRETKSQRSESSDLGNLANCYHLLDQPGEAVEHGKMALEMATQVGDRRSEGIARRNLVLFSEGGCVEDTLDE
eukprot:TRINITY_DN20599_c0_g1_i5.p1 TRINITY_DN20599_c0_g1~~TRINITY_DN20599_c0_g1_i5.p1  ORF type:complete len:320 (+),score=83.61 TRINITY_DN20599_c0_g1_i5:184-1143(+)